MRHERAWFVDCLLAALARHQETSVCSQDGDITELGARQLRPADPSL